MQIPILTDETQRTMVTMPSLKPIVMHIKLKKLLPDLKLKKKTIKLLLLKVK